MTDPAPFDAPLPRPVAGRAFPCGNCGASLSFAPDTGRLSCATCGTVNDLPDVSDAERASAFEERDYREALRAQVGNEPSIEQQIVSCPQCGAQTVFDPHVVASHCAFCAGPMVSVTAHTERRLQPQGLVPFVLEPAAAQARFRRWIEGRWFAPNALRRTVQGADGVRGVYVPCWTFDAETETDYVGQRGVNRTVTVMRRDAEGRTVPVTRIVTDWFPAAGRVRVAFDDAMILASHSVPKHLEDVLTGWDIGRLVPPSEAYLAGFTVEAYQVGLEPAFGEAQQRFASAIDQAVRRDIGGHQQRVARVHTRYGRVTFKHVLMPVWIASYRFGGRVFAVVVNGQTGVVQGDRPWSAWKIAGAVLGSALAAALLWGLTQGL
jgi:ribosomal protein S27AE